MRNEDRLSDTHGLLGNLMPIGFKEHEIPVLEALLVLGSARLDRPWRLSGDRANSFLLVKIDGDSDSIGLWQALVRDLGPERLIAAAPAELELAARWRIAVRSDHRPGLQDFIALLNRLGGETGLPDSEARPAASPVREPLGRFDPAEHFTALLEAACERGMNTYWEYGSFGIYGCPSEQAFFSKKSLEELLPLLTARPSDIAEMPVGETPTAEQFDGEGWKRHDLLELRWFAALVASRGRLSVNIDPAEPLHLVTMPEWVRLPYYNEYAAVAKYMASTAEPVGKIAAATGYTEREIADFVNACDALHLLISNRDAQEIAGFQQAARQRIKDLFGRHFGSFSKNQIKLVFTGSIGAGKTTTISLLSDYPIILTESRPTDDTRLRKRTTTVAMDYGCIVCRRDSKVHLYGTPGQRRFEFMGQILARSAFAIVIFISNIETDPLGDLKYYLDQYIQFSDQSKIVVAITHYDVRQSPTVADYERMLDTSGVKVPVIVADPRNVSGLVDLFERLFENYA